MVKDKLTPQQFYCVKTRSVIRLFKEDICVDFMKVNGVKRPILKGHCKKNKTTVYKFLKSKDYKKAVKKFGRCRRKK